MATRKYEQRLRARSADDTRRRILDAVYERLRDAPSQTVSVDRVARMAGVARSTVYLVFGSRAGLFDALGRDLMERSGYAGLIQAVGHPDAREHMRGRLVGRRSGLEEQPRRPRMRRRSLRCGHLGVDHFPNYGMDELEWVDAREDVRCDQGVGRRRGGCLRDPHERSRQVQLDTTSKDGDRACEIGRHGRQAHQPQ